MKNQSKRLFMECLNCISYWHIHMLIIVILSVSHVLRFATPWTAACQVYLSSTISWSLLRLMSVDLVMQSNQLILCHPLLLLAVYPSIRGFSNELALHIRWPKYRSFSISPSNEYSGLISFRIDWFELLAVQGTLKSLLQHRNSKAVHYSLPQIIQSSMGRKRPSCFPVVSRSLLYSSEKNITFIFA